MYSSQCQPKNVEGSGCSLNFPSLRKSIDAELLESENWPKWSKLLRNHLQNNSSENIFLLSDAVPKLPGSLNDSLACIISQEKQNRSMLQRNNKMLNVIYAKYHEVHILETIKRLSRIYIQYMYKMVASVIQNDKAQFGLLAEEVSNLEAELSQWEHDYDAKSKLNNCTPFSTFPENLSNISGSNKDTTGEFFQKQCTELEDDDSVDDSEMEDEYNDTKSSEADDDENEDDKVIDKEDEFSEPVDMSQKITNLNAIKTEHNVESNGLTMQCNDENLLIAAAALISVKDEVVHDYSNRPQLHGNNIIEEASVANLTTSQHFSEPSHPTHHIDNSQMPSNSTISFNKASIFEHEHQTSPSLQLSPQDVIPQINISEPSSVIINHASPMNSNLVNDQNIVTPSSEEGNYLDSSALSSGKKSIKLKIACSHPGCTYQATHLRRLVVHQLMHKGEQMYSCDFNGCDYQTNVPTNVKKHKKHLHKVLSGDKLYSYLVMDANGQNGREGTFARAQKRKSLTGEFAEALNASQQNQSDDSGEHDEGEIKKPKLQKNPNKQIFKCTFEECDYQATTKYWLQSHENKHKGIKPFACSFEGCTYRSLVKGSLSTHFKRAHGDNTVMLKSSLFRQQPLEEINYDMDDAMNEQKRFNWPLLVNGPGAALTS